MAKIQSPGSQWRLDLVSVCTSLASKCLSTKNVLIFKVPVGERGITAAFYRRHGGAGTTVAPGLQTLPVMEKHQSFLALIPHHHHPSLCSSRSICATINQILKWKCSYVKNEIFSSFVEGKTAEIDLALACPASCPGVAPLMTELLLLVAALDLLSSENPVLNPVWDSKAICAKMTLAKQGCCSCRSQTSGSN